MGGMIAALSVYDHPDPTTPFHMDPDACVRSYWRYCFSTKHSLPPPLRAIVADYADEALCDRTLPFVID
jgi:hypothetical protein